jgi:hypothetical protein
MVLLALGLALLVGVWIVLICVSANRAGCREDDLRARLARCAPVESRRESAAALDQSDATPAVDADRPPASWLDEHFFI